MKNLHGKHVEGLGPPPEQIAPGNTVNIRRMSETLEAAPARGRVLTRPELHRLLFGTGEQDLTGGTPLHTADGLLVEEESRVHHDSRSVCERNVSETSSKSSFTL